MFSTFIHYLESKLADGYARSEINDLNENEGIRDGSFAISPRAMIEIFGITIWNTDKMHIFNSMSTQTHTGE